jgi:hypothetical protein
MRAIIIRTIAALATFTTLIATPNSALAARLVQLTDGFEPPNSQWSFDGEGSSSTATLINNSSVARSGAWAAILWTRGNAWRSVGRQVTISGWTSANKGQCSTAFWVKSNSDYYVALNIEIINPVNWTYVALAYDTVPNGWGWRQVTVSNWVPPRGNVFVRLSAGGAVDRSSTYKQEMIAYVDDMVTSCVFN